MQAVTAL